MNDDSADQVSPYLLSPARTLREACRATGNDWGGKRCPGSSVKDLCKREERWLVELRSRARHV